MLTVKRPLKMMTKEYRLIFKKIYEVITLTRNTLYRNEIEIKNPPAFVLFFKTQQFMIYRIVTLLLPLTVYRMFSKLSRSF
jgi:hypothetical protein